MFRYLKPPLRRKFHQFFKKSNNNKNQKIINELNKSYPSTNFQIVENKSRLSGLKIFGISSLILIGSMAGYIGYKTLFLKHSVFIPYKISLITSKDLSEMFNKDYNSYLTTPVDNFRDLIMIVDRNNNTRQGQIMINRIERIINEKILIKLLKNPYFQENYLVVNDLYDSQGNYEEILNDFKFNKNQFYFQLFFEYNHNHNSNKSDTNNKTLTIWDTLNKIKYLKISLIKLSPSSLSSGSSIIYEQIDFFKRIYITNSKILQNLKFFLNHSEEKSNIINNNNEDFENDDWDNDIDDEDFGDSKRRQDFSKVLINGLVELNVPKIKNDNINNWIKFKGILSNNYNLKIEELELIEDGENIVKII